MNNPLIPMTHKAELIAPSISQDLNDRLHREFNIPKFTKQPSNDNELMLFVAGLLINFYGLQLELSGSPIKGWIDEHLGGFYLYNANEPTKQAVEQLSLLIERQGGNND